MVNFTYKLIIIGDTNVGKTAIIERYFDNYFNDPQINTIGVDFRYKIIDFDNKKIKIQIWDTAGQERFRSITRCYYRNSIGVIIAYDITNKTSFYSLKTWLAEIKASIIKNAVIMMVGNKSDMEKDRSVTYEEGKQFADDNNALFMEVSSKTSINTNEMFCKIVEQIYKTVPQQIKKNETIAVSGNATDQPNKKINCSC